MIGMMFDVFVLRFSGMDGNIVVSGSPAVISPVGLGFGGAGVFGTIDRQCGGMGDDVGDGTRGAGCPVGAGVGVNDSIELGNGDSIVDGLGFSTGPFVGVGAGIGPVAGVRLGDRGGVDEGIEIFCVDGIEDEQIDGIAVSNFGRRDSIGRVRKPVGASTGVSDGVGLSVKDGIDDGLEFGKDRKEVFVGIVVCALVGVGLREGVGIDDGIQIFSLHGTEDGQSDRIVVGAPVGNGVGIDVGFGLDNGVGIGE